MEEVAASAVLAGNTIDAVVDRTSGVPLFIEELTRLMIDSGGRSGTLEIPPTLHWVFVDRWATSLESLVRFKGCFPSGSAATAEMGPAL
jgi:hypothetical protein